MTEEELKYQFAEEWLRNPDNPFQAALNITNGNGQLSLKIADSWIRDPEVKAMKKQLIAKYGEDHFLPSQTSMLFDILNRARNCPMDEDYVKLMRLAADIRGMIQKPGVTINNNVTTNKVMVVPIRVGNDGQTVDSHEWERQLISQQQTLTANG